MYTHRTNRHVRSKLAAWTAPNRVSTLTTNPTRHPESAAMAFSNATVVVGGETMAEVIAINACAVVRPVNGATGPVSCARPRDASWPTMPAAA